MERTIVVEKASYCRPILLVATPFKFSVKKSESNKKEVAKENAPIESTNTTGKK
ncbi:hypothetical protein I6N96_10115 [Enterococcus sp. BWM-S5]|uniref:Uncharacterized protein n=1 Tax=Enterococcus larvae TaxID=2794352 RepID=A0ABS4CKD1_9ENTE|nr:hypothetical protein [Enterococcus larvae]MBP1046643.1 hypothetical protein [Enterococcus larvae]